ncbi:MULTISPECIES: hypothetical protein [unclassified Agarivorans]|uniref:hypothetical protein n=1 Tax=unclassified Agarivorans TaxID=2636026 RepID=UPI003D7E2D0F
MSETNWKWLLYISIGLGLTLVLLGVALAMFTSISVDRGVQGVQIIAGIIGAGLLLMVPSKILLTLMLMKDKPKRNPHTKL